MYSTDGDFGQVRLATLMAQAQRTELFTLSSVGWHCCNDRYRITRDEGSRQHLLLFTLRGEGFLRLRGRSYALLPGTVTLVPREAVNSYGTPTGGLWEFYWIHPAGAAETMLDLAAQSGVITAAFDAGFAYRQRLEELFALCTRRPLHFEWHLSRQLSEILHHAVLDLCAEPAQESLPRRAIAVMERRFAEKLTLAEVAQELFVSEAHLIRTFRQEIGCTPHQYLQQYRLMMAAQLVQYSDCRMDEIAARTGFSSSSHFISQFRQAHGCTPMQYRQQLSGR